MKICMLVHQNYYQDERVVRYATALIEEGHSVDVVCPRHPMHEHMKGSSPVHVITIPVMHTNGGSLVSLFIEYFFSLIFYFVILSGRQLLRRYDVVHVHNMPDFLVFAALIPRFLGKKIILDIHDPTPEFYQSKFVTDEKSLSIKMLKLEERLSIWFVHAVIAANENFRINLIKRGFSANKITTVRNFPDQRLYDPGKFPHKSNSNEFIAIYPGTIAPRYGLHIAIRGLARLKDDFPNLRIWFVGAETDHKQELRKLADSLEVSDQVNFLDVVASNQVPGLLAQADIGLYLAMPDVHMDIAIPTKVLEFTVMGLPVIASDLTVIRQLFQEDMLYLFSPGDVDGFAEQLKRAMVNKQDRQDKLNRIARDLLPLWSWRLEQQKYLKLIAQITKKEEVSK